MLIYRPSSERGYADHGWLKAKHTFSFASYYDPRFVGFGPLCVINEDRISGGSGFRTHPHDNMEIITYVVSGELKHEDSLGNKALIRPGEVQRMSAGTGIRHSEFNNLHDQQTHLLQIWIYPEQKDITPSYGQKSFQQELATGELILAASASGRMGSVSLSQDVNLYLLNSTKSGSAQLQNMISRMAWIQVVKGDVQVNGQRLLDGDGLGATEQKTYEISWKENSEFLFFDMKPYEV